MPYAGRIRVTGRTARDVQLIVEHALEGKAIQPQVLINVPHSVSNSVTVTGEVANGARVPLSVKGDRIMDVIAAAGGLRAPVNETYVQLSRGSSTIRVPMTRVASVPQENIYLRPNDVLTLIRDPQTFIAYGATTRNAEIPFDAEGITLSQALAKAGGLLDFRSDAAGVFVFRYEPEYVVRALRPDSPLAQPGRVTPVVYRLICMTRAVYLWLRVSVSGAGTCSMFRTLRSPTCKRLLASSARCFRRRLPQRLFAYRQGARAYPD